MNAQPAARRTDPTQPGTPARRRRRVVVAAAVATLLALLAVASVLGQEALGGKVRSGQDVTVASGETVATDLYLAGGNVTVDGTIEGDLVATGGIITINGSVTGDVLVAGGTVRLAGEVGEDARLTGGQLTVAGSVGEDLLVAGGTVDITSSGTVGEDVIASAGQLAIDGTVTGSVVGAAGTYRRGGTIGGSDDIALPPPPEPAQDRTVDAVADAVRHFLVVVLVGLLALWLAPRLTRLAAATVRNEPLRAAAWGIGILLGVLLLAIVIPIVAILLAVALGALGFDSLAAFDVFAGIVGVIALLLAYGFLAWIVADVIVGLGLARLVWTRDEGSATGDASPARWLVPLLIGAAIVVILTSLPILGPWLKLVVVLVGVGALLVAWRWGDRRPLTPGEPAVVRPA
jgi:hypothetical protein